jgi:hypothetical protein
MGLFHFFWGAAGNPVDIGLMIFIFYFDLSGYDEFCFDD